MHHARVSLPKIRPRIEPNRPLKRPIHIRDAIPAPDTDTQGNFAMIRNTILGLTAAAALTVAALAPTTASAGYYGHGYGYKSYHYAPSYSYGHSYRSHDYGYKSYGYGYRSYGY